MKTLFSAFSRYGIRRVFISSPSSSSPTLLSSLAPLSSPKYLLSSSFSTTPPAPSNSTPTPTVLTQFWTIPNIITLARISLSPLIGYTIVMDMKDVALLGCIVGAFSDWLDGYIAKNYNQKSIWGGIIDPIADKIFVGSIAAGLMMKGLFPWELFAITIGRDVILISSGLIIRGLEKDPDKPFFDASSATFEIVPTQLSKINTALQFLLLSCTLSHFYLNQPSLELLQPLWYLTAMTTIGSGLQYINGAGLKKMNLSTKTKRFNWD